MPEQRIVRVEGKITYEDDQQVEFLLTDQGITRWGNVPVVLGRAVDVTEGMQVAAVDAGYVPYGEVEGSVVVWRFTSLDRKGRVATRVEIKSVLHRPEPDMGRDERWYRLEISDVNDLLDAWKLGDEEHRSWRWPDTEAPDDPAVIALVGMDGAIHMDEWPATDDNSYDLAHVLDGTLLPGHHYEIERIR